MGHNLERGIQMGYSLNLPSLVIPQLSPITQYQTHTQITFFERMNGETYLMAEANSDFTLGNCPETEIIKGSRGGCADANIHIHSVRMPGYIASQEVIFGAAGQIFKIKHDTMDRSCYMSGVLLATRHVCKNNDFIYGLDNIMQ